MNDLASVKCRELVRDGRWLVPPEDRPKGWEKMPVREMEPIARDESPSASSWRRKTTTSKRISVEVSHSVAEEVIPPAPLAEEPAVAVSDGDSPDIDSLSLRDLEQRLLEISLLAWGKEDFELPRDRLDGLYDVLFGEVMPALCDEIKRRRRNQKACREIVLRWEAEHRTQVPLDALRDLSRQMVAEFNRRDRTKKEIEDVEVAMGLRPICEELGNMNSLLAAPPAVPEIGGGV